MLHKLEILSVLLSVACCSAAERDAVVLITQDGRQCSGVCVSPAGWILTAEHCGMGSGAKVTFSEQSDAGSHIATLVYEPPKNGLDEAMLLKITSAWPLPFVEVRSIAPPRGHWCSSMGYPGGRYAELEGKVVDVSSEAITTDFRIFEGHSGGPLFMNGKVVGLASTRSQTVVEGQLTGRSTKPSATWISTRSIHTALQATGKPTLVCFSANGCQPCERFKADVRNGEFDSYNVVIVTHNPRSDTWDKPAYMNEFVAAARPRGRLPYPTFWIQGGSKFTSGYSGRTGLLGWIVSAVEHLIGGIMGKADKDFEVPQGPPDSSLGQPDNFEREANPPQSIALSEIGKVKDSVQKILSDVKRLKDGGVIGKVKALADLKRDVNEAKRLAMKAKDDATGDPKHFLLGLLGLLPGLVRSHFRNKDLAA